MRRAPDVEQRMTDLVSQLQQLAKRPTFSFRLDELHALFTVAYEEDVEHGGRYDAWSAAITLWTHAWPHPWTAPATEDSRPKGSFYVAWGRPPGLWLIEVQENYSLANLLQELGHLELKGLGYLKHGERPAAG